EPRQQREDGFRSEWKGDAAQRYGGDSTGNDGKGQYNEPGQYEAKQQAFLHKQRWHGVQRPVKEAAIVGILYGAVQLAVERCHEHGMQGVNGYKAGCLHREHEEHEHECTSSLLTLGATAY